MWCGGGGVLNWAIGIDTYTVMCIKLMTDLKKKKLTFSYRIEIYLPYILFCFIIMLNMLLFLIRL